MAPPLKFVRETYDDAWLGWLTGFEPATTGITIQDSTVELQPPRICKSIKLACPTGLEPVTPSLEGWCSIQLSYGQILY